jgi:hypothetical protein
VNAERSVVAVAAKGRPTPAAPAWRIVPQLDQYPYLVGFAETLPGRVALFACLLVGLELSSLNFAAPACGAGHILGCFQVRPYWAGVALLAALAAYGGRLRWWVVPFGGLMFFGSQGSAFPAKLVSFLAQREGGISPLALAVLGWALPAVILVLSAAIIACARRFPGFFLFRRPILFMTALVLGLALVAESGALHGMALVALWSLAAALGVNFAVLSYPLLDVSAGDRSPLVVQAGLGTFHRIWGYTVTPFGKGAVYLRKFEAKSPAELAVTQLKGLKLLTWALLLLVAEQCFEYTVHGLLGVPDYTDAFAAQIGGHSYAWPLCWASLAADFFENLLDVSWSGGIVIACARMAGFRLLRNTYRPLQAKTIAEFWNRYLYYFKEFLVDFFFYPTFLRFFRKHRPMRLFFATFMAACVGNVVYHFVGEIDQVAELGAVKAIVGFQTYVFYGFLLALGITASQLRPRKARTAEHWFHDRVLPPLRVLMFYCILHIFDYDGREYSLWEHFRFLFHLFGVDT